MPSGVSLSEGQLYHLVFKNLDPGYAANFYSIDDIVMERSGSVLPVGDRVQSGFNTIDWGVAYKTDSDPWTNASPESNGNDHTPVLDLKWTDGHHLGNGYMEVWTGKMRDKARPTGW